MIAMTQWLVIIRTLPAMPHGGLHTNLETLDASRPSRCTERQMPPNMQERCVHSLRLVWRTLWTMLPLRLAWSTPNVLVLRPWLMLKLHPTAVGVVIPGKL
mmetsp:Transcript_66229/g.158420  ORF Transcript_66229/g.158420 Transcript_66229/m.158420 type:complete len:101 (+) Transcript_66229:243-545(+)